MGAYTKTYTGLEKMIERGGLVGELCIFGLLKVFDNVPHRRIQKENNGFPERNKRERTLGD